MATTKRRKRKFTQKKNFDRTKVNSKWNDNYEVGSDKETNDPSWYAQYPELMRDAASIPYSIPTGTEISWNLDVDPSNPLSVRGPAYYTMQETVPGIMTLGIIPTFGISDNATSPINVATKMLYTKVRAENSGARNYDAPDLMIYCLAMDQVYSLLTWYNRIYGIIMLYSQVNRYLPKALLDAQMVKFDDLLLHINDFKAFLDTAIAQAAVFSVPNDMTLFNRHAFMYQNVYKDAESVKSQLYQFAPRAFYYYDEYNGAGRLMPIDILSTYPNGMAFADLVNLFYSIMNPIIASEDFNIMSGDILKAFGADHLIKLQLMPQGYTIIPVVDYEVLTQIKNASLSNLTTTAMLSMSSDPANWSLHQDANVEYLEYNPYLTTPNVNPRYNTTNDLFLSTYKTDPQPADNMVYTRLMYVTKRVEVDDNGTTKYQYFFDSVGSEVVSACTVTMFHYDTNGNWLADQTAIHVLSNNLVTGTGADIGRITMSKHFDFCPALYLFHTGGGATHFMPLFDLDNWTIVHAYELEKMHRTALMSMLRVPMIGSALPANLRSK